MFTQRVRTKLREDFGIKSIPNDLLAYLVAKHKARYELEAKRKGKCCDAATCAWLVANDWQKGERI